MKHTFIISPFSRALRNGKLNPKNYPYWGELILLLSGARIETVQIGISGEPSINCSRGLCDASFEDILKETKKATAWISVDNFFQHFCHYHKLPGVAIFGKSDPNIFGYPENLNILKDKKFLRAQQFAMWDDEPFDPNVFLSATEVFHIIQEKYDLSSVLSFNINQI